MRRCTLRPYARWTLHLQYESIKTKPKHTLNNLMGARWNAPARPIRSDGGGRSPPYVTFLAFRAVD